MEKFIEINDLLKFAVCVIKIHKSVIKNARESVIEETPELAMHSYPPESLYNLWCIENALKIATEQIVLPGDYNQEKEFNFISIKKNFIRESINLVHETVAYIGFVLKEIEKRYYCPDFLNREFTKVYELQSKMKGENLESDWNHDNNVMFDSMTTDFVELDRLFCLIVKSDLKKRNVFQWIRSNNILNNIIIALAIAAIPAIFTAIFKVAKLLLTIKHMITQSG